MRAYLLRRLFSIVPVLLGVTLLVFLIMQLTPGDPVRALLGEMGQGASQAQLDRIRDDLGLNLPVWRQYVHFLGRLVQGDLGDSFRSGLPVWDEIMLRLPYTLELTLASLGVAVALGLPAGVLSAVRRNTVLDYLVTVGSLVGISFPVFWLGILLMLLFSLQLGILPASGSGSWQHLILPAVTVGLSSVAFIARLTRNSVLETLGEDFVRTARSKGLPVRSVIGRHVLRNSLMTVVTAVGLQFGALLGGAVLTETVFAWPGLGRLTVQAIAARDLPLIQGCIFFVAVIFTLTNTIVDVLYGYLDPRIRYD